MNPTLLDLPRTSHPPTGRATLGDPTEALEAVAGLGVPLLGARVVVVSGSFGAGHDAACAQLVDRLHHAGCTTRTLDVVDFFPAGFGRVVRWTYPRLLRWWPAGWALILSVLTPGRPAHRAVTTLLGRIERRLATAVEGADIVISTHPFASQALGCQRAARRLHSPVATYLTDASVHALWVHPDVDLHLALHPAAAEQTTGLLASHHRLATARGLSRPRQSRVQLVHALAPAVYDGRLPAPRRAHLRRSLGVRAEAPLLLVVGGSLGVGSLRRAACDLRDLGAGTPLVVCGRNRMLLHRLRGEPGVSAVGWRSDLPDLIRAADCVVQNAGGFTAWEALAAGVPVVTYRALRGHGETNAAALASDGLVPWPRTPTELGAAVAVALARPPGVLPVVLPDAL